MSKGIHLESNSFFGDFGDLETSSVRAIVLTATRFLTHVGPSLTDDLTDTRIYM